MTVFAKMLSLEGLNILGPGGKDLATFRVEIEGGAVESEQLGVLENEKIVFHFFPNLHHIAFETRLTVIIRSHDNFTGMSFDIGTEVISADEADQGVQFLRFDGSGALYELAYEVVDLPDL